MEAAADRLWKPRYLGEAIATLRRRRGLSQKQLAAEVRAYGVALEDTNLSRFERWGSGEPGARKPSFAQVWVIAEILGVKVSELGAVEEDFPELGLIRQGLATPSIVTGKGSDGSAERRLLLMLRGGRRPDSQLEQPTLDSSLIRSVTSSVTRARRRRG